MDMNGYEWLMAQWDIEGIPSDHQIWLSGLPYDGNQTWFTLRVSRENQNKKSPNSMKVSGVEMIYTVNTVNGGLSIAIFDYQRVREIDQTRWGDLTRYNGA